MFHYFYTKVTVAVSSQTCYIIVYIKYDKQDQQGKAAFNERNPHTTQQQEPVARSLDGPQTKTGQGTRQSTCRSIA
jgi:hypothetical protein